MFVSTIINPNGKVVNIDFTPRRYLAKDIIVINGFKHTMLQWKRRGYSFEHFGFAKIQHV